MENGPVVAGFFAKRPDLLALRKQRATEQKGGKKPSGICCKIMSGTDVRLAIRPSPKPLRLVRYDGDRLRKTAGREIQLNASFTSVEGLKCNGTGFVIGSGDAADA